VASRAQINVQSCRKFNRYLIMMIFVLISNINTKLVNSGGRFDSPLSHPQLIK